MAKYNTYPMKASPEAGDTVLIYDAAGSANKQTYFSNFANFIATVSTLNGLQTVAKTIVASINEVKGSADAANTYIALTQVQKDSLRGLLN